MSDDNIKMTVIKQRSESLKKHNRKMRQLRSKLRNMGFQKAKEFNLGSRQLGNLKDDEDIFSNIYGSEKLIVPEYYPGTLYRLVEESSVLPKNIDAMVDNIPGFGYEFRWCGNDKEPETDSEKEAMKNILTQANETESFLTVRRAVRRDMESTGNGYYEVTRFPTREVAMIYHSNAVYTRIAPKDDAPVSIYVKMKRGGKERIVTVKKRFRRYVYCSPKTGKLRWFKEFGDPRNMSYKTGEYNSSKYAATEMIHVPCKGGATLYGQPRWIGNVLSVMGVRDSDYINHDIFQNQGIPPFIVTVSGGMLTGESLDELEQLLMDQKGKANFNKVAILEAEDTSGQIDADNKAKIELKSLIEYRKEDSMFRNYNEDVDAAVRESFRLPPLYVGNSGSYTFASSKTSRLACEEQVMRPARSKEDEIINNTIFKDITNWKLRTKGPEIIRSDELSTMFSHVTNSGAMTPNSAIQIMNQLFDLELPPREEEWGDIPIMIIQQLAKTGRLAIPDEIMSDDPVYIPDASYDKKPDPVGYNLDEENISK